MTTPTQTPATPAAQAGMDPRAFPASRADGRMFQRDGMTLRDYFAAHALAGFWAITYLTQLSWKGGSHEA